MLIDELMLFNLFTSKVLYVLYIMSDVVPHVITISDRYGAPQSPIDPNISICLPD
nr:hypothetical protein [uncultured Bacteroides sp.]